MYSVHPQYSTQAPKLSGAFNFLLRHFDRLSQTVLKPAVTVSTNLFFLAYHPTDLIFFSHLKKTFNL